MSDTEIFEKKSKHIKGRWKRKSTVRDTVRKGIVISVFCMFFSTAQLFGSFYPFLFSTVGYIFLERKSLRIFTLAGLIFLLVLEKYSLFLSLCIYTALLYIINLTVKSNMSSMLCGTLCAVFTFFSVFMLSGLQQGGSLFLFASVIEGVLCFVSYFIFRHAFCILFDKTSHTHYSEQDLLSVGLIPGAISLGLSSFSVFGLSPGPGFFVFSGLAAGYRYGYACSFSVSLMNAVLLIFSGVLTPNEATALLLSIVFANLLFALDSFFVFLFFIVSTEALFFIIHKSFLPEQLFFSLSIGAFIFFIHTHLFARKNCNCSSFVQKTPPVMNEAISALVKEEFQSHKNLLNELEENILYQKYNEAEKEESEFIRTIQNCLCRHCEKRTFCYNEHKERTLYLLQRLYTDKETIPGAELPSYVTHNCIQKTSMFTLLCAMAENRSAFLCLSQKNKGMRNLLSHQLKNMCMMLDCLYGRLTKNLSINTENSEFLTSALKAAMYPVDGCIVMEDFYKRTTIFIKTTSPLTKPQYNTELTHFLEKALKYPLCFEHSLDLLHEDKRLYIFAEKYPYKVSFGVARSTKNENAHCGDNFCEKILRKGVHLFCISDGMGSGKIASEQSNRVLDMLEELLNTGYSEIDAIKTINSILVLEEKEMFATLDIFLFDLRTGVGKFVKAGATNSYIKRNDVIKKIHYDSMPIGILDEINIQKGTYNLKKDDCIYIMSDGLEDSLQKGEETLLSVFKQNTSRNPQKSADCIIETILKQNNGKAFDDMSLLVLKIRKEL